MAPYMAPEWLWRLYVAWTWLLQSRPVTHRKAFWDARESDLDWIALRATKALEALETLPEGIGSEKARGHLYQILQHLS